MSQFVGQCLFCMRKILITKCWFLVLQFVPSATHLFSCPVLSKYASYWNYFYFKYFPGELKTSISHFTPLFEYWVVVVLKFVPSATMLNIQRFLKRGRTTWFIIVIRYFQGGSLRTRHNLITVVGFFCGFPKMISMSFPQQFVPSATCSFSWVLLFQ